MSRYRHKPGISSRDYQKRPSLFRQRQAFQEIGTSSKASALFRNSIAALLQRGKDSKTHLRFNSAMYRVLSKDTINPVGDRKVENGNIQLLQGFAFNAFATLHNILFAAGSYSINRTEGQCTWRVNSFQPIEKLKAPPGASHFKLVSAGVEVDFANSIAMANINESGYLLLDGVPTGDVQLTSAVTPNTSLPLFLVAGVQFYEKVNNNFYALNDKKFNPLMIVEVDA